MPSPLEHLGKTWLNASGFKSHFVESAAGPLHYFESLNQDPSLPTLVALHGLSSGAMPLGPVLKALKPHYGRIIAPDMPGHGFSACPDKLDIDLIYESIAALLDELLQGQAVFFGHSLGGAVSLRIALERPEMVRGLILLSPAGAPTPVDAHEVWMERFQMVNQRAAHAFVNALYVDKPAFLPIVAWTCRRLFRRPSVRQILATTRRDRVLRPGDLESLTMPLRFIWGGSERTLLPAHRDFFLAHLPPHAEVLTPQHFTHCPYLEYPDQVAALVTGFALEEPALREVVAA